MGQLLFTAIVVSKVEGIQQEQFAKYRNIAKNRFPSLCKFAIKTFPGLHHINLYEKGTKRFYMQLKKTDIEVMAGTVLQNAWPPAPALQLRTVPNKTPR